MKITITKDKLLELINKGLKDGAMNGISFKDAKVTDLSINGSDWHQTNYDLELIQDYAYSSWDR